MNYPEYTVAIRTLGKSGDKYQKELDSILAQIVTPRNVFVYLPEGYSIPKETIGIEKVIKCKEGMVAQRSLSFDEIDTEYILFLDDDVYLPPNGVKALFDGVLQNDGDCISPDVFPNHRWPIMKKIRKAIGGTFPRCDDGWAMKILPNGQYSYNNSPHKDVLPTQSLAGPCILIKKEVFKKIHFEDERWMDKFRYALGEDTAFAYKLYNQGYNVLIHYNSGIIHLDTGSSMIGYDMLKMNVKCNKIEFIDWYRMVFDLKKNSCAEKILCVLAYSITQMFNFFIFTIKCLKVRNFRQLIEYIKSILWAYKYVHSEEYKSIPRFDTNFK